MKRRTFNKVAPLGAAGLILPNSFFGERSSSTPKPLKKGSKIGLIAPSFRIDGQRLDRAIKNIGNLGFEPYHTPNILQRQGYLAGSDAIRLSEVHQMYADKSIDGIWCVEGGYGATRIIDELDFDLIRNNPKPLIGFSDITALLQAIYKHTGSPCFHGPNIGYELTAYEKYNLAPCYGLKEPFVISSFEGYETPKDEIYNKYVLVPGKARGKLLGGNLSLLVSLIGTEHELRFKDAIVFIEDIGEEPYRIDRMLTHLLSAGILEGVKGIVLGIFHDCDQRRSDTQTLKEVIADRLKGLGVPTIYGFSFSHVKNQCTFPLGVEAELNAQAYEVKLLNDPYQKMN